MYFYSQSLLERNKNLLGKMQAFEQYMSESGDRVKMSPISPV